MLSRALIVLLVILNLGVAVWWLTRTEPAKPAPPQIPAGVPQLELVTMPAASSAAAVEVSPGAPSGTVLATSAAGLCFRLGPFADRATAEQSQSKLSGLARAEVRQVPAASGYTVSLPPAASREAALALAQRIRQAGFDDFLVINQGDQMNGVALGRYRNRESAQRRQAQLAAAGFAAQVHPIGGQERMQWWLDMRAEAGTLARTLQAQAGVPAQAQDCPATLR